MSYEPGTEEQMDCDGVQRQPGERANDARQQEQDGLPASSYDVYEQALDRSDVTGPNDASSAIEETEFVASPTSPHWHHRGRSSASSTSWPGVVPTLMATLALLYYI